MFDIGMLEMFVLVVLAIIVVGPRDLPKLLRNVGKFVRKVKEMSSEFQNSLRQIADEVELEEVTRKLNEAGNIPLDDLDIKPDLKPETAPPDGEEKPDAKQGGAAPASPTREAVPPSTSSSISDPTSADEEKTS